MTVKQLREKCTRYGFPDTAGERADMIFRLQELETLNNSMLDGEVAGQSYKSTAQLVTSLVVPKISTKASNCGSVGWAVAMRAGRTVAFAAHSDAGMNEEDVPMTTCSLQC